MRMSIPKRLHQMWIADGPPCPDLYMEWHTEWKTLHPDWQVILWTEPPPLRNQAYYDAAHDLFPSAPQQLQADIARYEILETLGGCWVDMDTIPHKPLDDLMESSWVVRHSGKWFANGIMAFTSGHLAMRDAVEKLPASIDRAMPHHGNTKRSGPQFLTPILRRYIRSGELRALPEDYFLPFDWSRPEMLEKGLRGIYGTHVFHNQRRKRGMELTTLEP